MGNSNYCNFCNNNVKDNDEKESLNLATSENLSKVKGPKYNQANREKNKLFHSKMEEEYLKQYINYSNSNDLNFDVHKISIEEFFKEIPNHTKETLLKFFHIKNFDFSNFKRLFLEITDSKFIKNKKINYEYNQETEYFDDNSEKTSSRRDRKEKIVEIELNKEKFDQIDFADKLKKFLEQSERIKIGPLKFTFDKLVTNYYWGYLNKDYEKHGFGIFLTSRKDLYLGNFAKNSLDGNGIFIKKHDSSNLAQQTITNINQNDSKNIFKNINDSNGNEIRKSTSENQNEAPLPLNSNIQSDFKTPIAKDQKIFDTTISKDGEQIKQNELNIAIINNLANFVYSYDTDMNLINIKQDIYIGEFTNDLIEGFGNLFLVGGERYFGSFKNCKKHGSGKFIFKDKSCYEGEFHEDKIEGKGKFIYKDGSFYEGNFLDSKFNGIGEMHWIDGRVYKGDWSNNKLNGKGINKFENGNIYDGDYHEDRKRGKGIYYWDTRKYFEGNFLNNKFHGKGFLCYNNNIIPGIWNFGRMIINEKLRKND